MTTGYDIRPEVAGAVRIGSPVAAVRAACVVTQDTTRLGDEALPERVLTVRTARGPMEVVVDSGRVWRVSIRDPGLRTTDSLGVGSTLGQLLARPATHGVEGEGGLFVVLGGRCGLRFRLGYEVRDDEHRDEWTRSDLGRLPAAARVDELLVVKCFAG